MCDVRYAVCGEYRAQGHPAASQIRSLKQSPTCALIDLVIGGRLCCPIPVSCPVRLDRHTLIRLCIAVVPQERSTRRGNVLGSELGAGELDVQVFSSECLG